MKLSEIDKNFAVQPVDAEGLCWTDAHAPCFSLHGLLPCGRGFMRMPHAIAEQVNSGVANLSANTSGGRLRFVTNSTRLAIKTEMPRFRIPHMADMGSSAFDVTVEENGAVHTTLLPPAYEWEGGDYTCNITLGESQLRQLTINFPLYNDVLALGADGNASREVYYLPRLDSDRLGYASV